MVGQGSGRAITAAIATMAVLLSAAEARGFFEGYDPLDAVERAQRVPLRLEQRRCGPGFLVGVGPMGLYLSEDREGLVVAGPDRGGQHFRVELRTFARGCSAWSADLDRDGVRDLVLVGATGGIGLAPTTRLTALLFDGAGRPVPWEVDGFYEVDDRGVGDMLDLDGDGRAELVRMSFSDGYWVTVPYEAQAARWHLRVGDHGDRVYPLYTRFTRRPNHEPSDPWPDRSPFVEDLSNSVPQASGPARIAALGWGDPPLSEGPVLVLSDGRQCEPGAGETSITVVVDRPDGRDAAVLGVNTRARQLLEEVTLAGMPVFLAGRRSDRVCAPELVWAYEP